MSSSSSETSSRMMETQYNLEQPFRKLSLNSLSEQHPVLCSLLNTPCQQGLIVTTRRQQSQEGGLEEGWGSSKTPRQ